MDIVLHPVPHRIDLVVTVMVNRIHKDLASFEALKDGKGEETVGHDTWAYSFVEDH